MPADRSNLLGVQAEGAAGPASAGALSDHGAFLARLARVRQVCQRRGMPLSLMMLDLDEFRKCNECYSPAFGDAVLRWFTAVLEEVRRPVDLLTRYQSDRFLLALPDASATVALQIAHACRQRMRRTPPSSDGRQHLITASFGIVESTPGCIENEQQLIRRCRIGLEHAKHLGGDRIITWSELLELQPSARDVQQQLSAEGIAHWMRRIRQQLRSTHLQSTRALIAAVEAKDPYTRAHSVTVADYAETIARRMDLPPALVQKVHAAALLHDIGKIGVPDAILTKPGPLTGAEFEVVKRHPRTAFEILEHVSFLADERPMILHHHERYDGAGYPCALAGTEIPVGARVLAVADALDTMLSPRSYKPAFDVEHVRAEIAAGAGRQFDPHAAAVTLRWLEEAPDRFRREAASPPRSATPPDGQSDHTPASLRSTAGRIPPLR